MIETKIVWRPVSEIPQVSGPDYYPSSECLLLTDGKRICFARYIGGAYPKWDHEDVDGNDNLDDYPTHWAYEFEFQEAFRGALNESASVH